MVSCHIHSRTEGNPTLRCQGPGTFKAKALGFTRSLVNVAYLEKVVFFYDFHGFGGIRSTQPTVLGSVFSKIDPYGSVRNADRIWASTPQNREEIRRNTQANTPSKNTPSKNPTGSGVSKIGQKRNLTCRKKCVIIYLKSVIVDATVLLRGFPITRLNVFF